MTYWAPRIAHAGTMKLCRMSTIYPWQHGRRRRSIASHEFPQSPGEPGLLLSEDSGRRREEDLTCSEVRFSPVHGPGPIVAFTDRRKIPSIHSFDETVPLDTVTRPQRRDES